MRKWITFAGLGLAAAVLAGCHAKIPVDKGTFQTALNNYYSGQPVCLFSEALKFPAPVDPNNQNQTKGFEALTDAGMLMHAQAEKQVSGYDLTPKGRSKWTPEPTQPGYGNFCFGTPQVTAVNNYTALDSSGDAYTVNYQFSVVLPDWVRTDEMMTAFPSIDRVSVPRAASANVVRSGTGWTVQQVMASGAMPRQLQSD